MTDRQRFALGLCLTAVAGWVDAIGYLRLGGLYTSFMSGNTTQFGIGLVRADWAAVGAAGLLIGLFVVGAFVGTAIVLKAGRWHMPAALAGEGVLLAVALGLSLDALAQLVALAPLAAAMGLQNAALRRARGTYGGVTYISGVLVSVGQGLAETAFGAGEGRWKRHGLIWIALTIGAAGGAAADLDAGLGPLALAPPTGAIVLVALVLVATRAGVGGSRSG